MITLPSLRTIGPQRIESGPDGSRPHSKTQARRRSFLSAPVLSAPYTHLRFVVNSTNPKGIPAQSPGLRGTSNPGYARAGVINPERVACGRGIGMRRFWPQPPQGWRLTPTQTPGNSQTATPWLVSQNP